MPLPISRSALDRLGKRLCLPNVSDDDWDTFASVLDTYQAVLDDGQEVLERAGFTPTTRVKSTGTLIEKLRRGTSFKSVQDVAGARVVVTGGRIDQDRAVLHIVQAFDKVGSCARVLDRRANPNHGYRAVHVIVTHHGLPVEIQVRTPLQDLWAQITERLGDLWGRELRYGEPLNPPNEPLVPGMVGFTREMFVRLLMETADEIDLAEAAQVLQYQERPDLPLRWSEQIRSAAQLTATEDTLRKMLDSIMGLVKTMEGA